MKINYGRNNMAWVAVDKTGIECIFENKPERIPRINQWIDVSYTVYGDSSYDVEIVVTLPHGTIKKLIGRDLTWEDEPVELEEE